MASTRPPGGGTRHTFSGRFRRPPEREAPPAFGETLRQARRGRGLSLEDAERDTRIPLKYLAALEAQEHGALPGGVYARGLLRAYATYLELDPEPLLADFRPPRPRDDRSTVRPALLPAPEGPPLSWSLLVLVLVALGTALLTAYLYGQYVALSESLQVPERPAARGGLDIPEPLIAPWTPLPRITPTPFLVAAAPPPDEPAAEAPAETPDPGATPGPGTPTPAPGTPQASPGTPPAGGVPSAPTPSPTATPVPAPTATPTPRAAVTVEARVLEPSWLQVWADGRQVFAATVPAGNTRAFTANDTLQMRVSNAGGVQVTVNGEPQGRLGASGQAVDITWGRR